MARCLQLEVLEEAAHVGGQEVVVEAFEVRHELVAGGEFGAGHAGCGGSGSSSARALLWEKLEPHLASGTDTSNPASGTTNPAADVGKFLADLRWCVGGDPARTAALHAAFLAALKMLRPPRRFVCDLIDGGPTTM